VKIRSKHQQDGVIAIWCPLPIRL